MAIDYRLPKLAMSMNEGTINQWLVKQGDKVEQGQAILELETDKVVQEIESPASGYFHIIATEGETHKVGVLIAQICESEQELASLHNPDLSSKPVNSEAVVENTVENTVANVAGNAVENIVENVTENTEPEHKTHTETSSHRIIASPLAKKIARDHQVDLALLTGTGPKGRIIKQDVMAALDTLSNSPLSLTERNTESAEKARIPIKGMRKVIADNMKASLQNAAQLSSVWESDITDLLAMRQRLAAREKQLGTRISINAFILKAISYAAEQVPVANACVQGEELVVYNTINIGIAVSVPGSTEYDSGLLVPVLKDIGNKGLVEIDLAMKALIAQARDNALTADELTGSTITMTSTAGLAPPGCQSTPIINRPNAIIINPSTPKEKPAVYRGDIVPRMLMPLSLTFDHCLLDGDPAVRFASALHECLENPELLLA